MPSSAKPSSWPQVTISRASCEKSKAGPLVAALEGPARFSGTMMPIIAELRALLPDAEATASAGARLAPGLAPGMLVTLSGELGSGKTTLVRGMLRGLGWAGTVKSPTYTLLEHYFVSSLYFYHFDLYRFNDPEEWDRAGFSEYLRPDTVCVLGWS